MFPAKPVVKSAQQKLLADRQKLRQPPAHKAAKTHHAAMRGLQSAVRSK